MGSTANGAMACLPTPFEMLAMTWYDGFHLMLMELASNETPGFIRWGVTSVTWFE
jgi:hypothetical protein